jgi:hypothetical protein
MAQTIQDLYKFDSEKLKLLAFNDPWWKNAVAWYEVAKGLSYDELSHVHKGWLAQMKSKYNQAN